MTKSSGLESRNETPITKMGNVLLRLSLNHHALRHHCERKRISAIIRVETTT